MNFFKSFLMLTLSASVLITCNSGYEYWDISQFEINENALADGEEIMVLYNSQGPDNNEDLGYYYHMIVVSQESGDTVNVLTTANTVFSEDYKGKTLNFYDQNNIATKAMQNFGDFESVEDLENAEEVEIDKVARDPKFDQIADNDYPTVIGSIGKTTKN
ncbi:hypothetical protein [Halocola ammonii]